MTNTAAATSDNFGNSRPWTRREQLALVSAVDRVGDRAWTSVARLIAPLSDGAKKRLPSVDVDGEGGGDAAVGGGGFFSARDCARRYSELLASAAAASEDHPESLLQRLTRERIAELQELADCVAQRYRLLAMADPTTVAARPASRRRFDPAAAAAAATDDVVLVVSEAELAQLVDKADTSSDGRRKSGAGRVRSQWRHLEDDSIEEAAVSDLAAAASAEEASCDDELGAEEEEAATSAVADTSTDDEDEDEPEDEDARSGADSSANAAEVEAEAADYDSTAAADATEAELDGTADEAQLTTADSVSLSASLTASDIGGSAAAGVVAKSSSSGVAVKDFYVSSPEPSDTRAVKQWRKQIMSVLRWAMAHKHGSVFLHPVSEDIAPGYSKVVLHPMDLSTLKRTVDSGEVATTRQFLRQLYLIFLNAVMYNNSDQPVHAMALEIWQDTCSIVGEFLGGSASGGGPGGGSAGGEDMLTKSLRHHHARRQSELLLHHQTSLQSTPSLVEDAGAAAAAPSDDSAAAAARTPGPPAAKKRRL